MASFILILAIRVAVLEGNFPAPAGENRVHFPAQPGNEALVVDSDALAGMLGQGERTEPLGTGPAGAERIAFPAHVRRVVVVDVRPDLAPGDIGGLAAVQQDLAISSHVVRELVFAFDEYGHQFRFRHQRREILYRGLGIQQGI